MKSQCVSLRSFLAHRKGLSGGKKAVEKSLVWPVPRFTKMIHHSYDSIALKSHLSFQNCQEGSH